MKIFRLNALLTSTVVYGVPFLQCFAIFFLSMGIYCTVYRVWCHPFDFMMSTSHFFLGNMRNIVNQYYSAQCIGRSSSLKYTIAVPLKSKVYVVTRVNYFPVYNSRQGRYALHGVCLFVSLLVWLPLKAVDEFWMNFLERCDLWLPRND